MDTTITIRRLPPETSGKIAAGEIIERPVNVVKELLENALDAAAARVTINSEDGGRTLIQVCDDGTGIPAAELPLAAENYSTSKIADISDLERITTLGFRGEALASIRSVSRLTIRSREASEKVGREIHWREGVIAADAPAVMNSGTVVTVADLFYNLPARRKFLAGDASEIRRISFLVQSYGLAYPHVSMTLFHRGKEVLAYPSCSFAERVEMVFGSSVFPNLRYFECSDAGMRVYGYASLPSVTRGNRGMQFVFVNGRLVRDRVILNALRQAYRSTIADDRFPMAVLKLEAPPDGLDINVHPTKAEVRFASAQDVHRLVSNAVRDASRGTTISFRDKVESVYRAIFTDRAETGSSAERGELAPPHADIGAGTVRGGGEWLFRESPEPLLDAAQEEPSPSSGRLYWQLHRSYIMIQIRGGMVIIDQHAAHERILFDEARRSVEAASPVIQSLLFPATIDLSPDEYERYESISQLLPKLGFETEPFGMRSIIVRGIPAGIRNWDDGNLLREILSDLGGPSVAIDAILRSYACHSAVRAGDRLGVEEMESLSDRLFATEFPFTCPHGRPTMLRVDLYELERRFHRSPGTDR